MLTNVYIGVDPGIGGGMAAIVETDYGQGTRKRHVVYTSVGEYCEIRSWLAQFEDFGRYALIEKVHSSPQQGVASAFTFGKIAGALEMALCCAYIEPKEVRPKQWMDALSILSGKTGGWGRKKLSAKEKYQLQKAQKQKLLDKAKELFPQIDLWDQKLENQRAMCDALLIAEYCYRLRKDHENASR
jgi:hypothetical protein